MKGEETRLKKKKNPKKKPMQFLGDTELALKLGPAKMRPESCLCRSFHRTNASMYPE